jgi:hypothetical protein
MKTFGDGSKTVEERVELAEAARPRSTPFNSPHVT